MVRPNRRANKKDRPRLAEIQAREQIELANRARRAKERAERRRAYQERMAREAAQALAGERDTQGATVGADIDQNALGDALAAQNGLPGNLPTGQLPPELLDDAGDPDDPDEETGVRGHLITSKRYLRSDARIAAELLSSGVVSKEVAEALMRSAYVLASKSSQEGNARNFVALMRLITLWPKLEIDHRAAVRKFGHPVAAAQVNVSVAPPTQDPAAAPVAAQPEQARQTAYLDPESLAKILSQMDQQGISPDASIEAG